MSDQFFIRDGASRERRLPAALARDYFNADELSMESILAFCAEYAQLLNFYDQSGAVDGSWAELIRCDETVLLAVIERTDLARFEKTFKQYIIEDVRQAEKLAQLSYLLAQMVDGWFKDLSSIQNDNAQRLANELSKAIGSVLSSNINDLQQKILGLQFHDFRPDFTSFSYCWNIESAGTNNERIAQVASTNNKTFFNKNFYAFFHLGVYAQKLAGELIGSSIKTAQHAPQTGLLVAFTKLYTHAQSALNTFTQRHLEFYYNDVLKVRANKHVPDKVLLVAELNNTRTSVEIPKGTAFVAGTDANNKEILYIADYTSKINTVQLAKAYTLNFHHDEYISPGCLGNMVSGVYSRQLLLPKETVNDCSAPIPSWPALGAIQSQNSELPDPEHGIIGFALSSKVLRLENGICEITVDLQFSAESYREFLNKIYLLAQRTKMSTSELIEKCCARLFKLRFTTKAGWSHISEHSVAVSQKDNDQMVHNCMQLQFSVDANLTPIIAYSEELHGGNYGVGNPLLMVELAQDAYVFGYSLLEDLVLEAYDIYTTVRQVSNLYLQNNDGRLDQSIPFYPFGSIPTCNSYLMLGCQDLLGKKIDNLRINIQWAELPTESFGAHYREYGTGTENKSFKADVSFLSKGDWTPKDRKTRDTFHLFDSDENDRENGYGNSGKLSADRSISIERLGRLDTDWQQADKPFAYSFDTQSGFIKITLQSPHDAFGHKNYPMLLSEALQHNVQKGDKVKLPKEPYTPLIEKISIDYEASELINVKESDRHQHRNTFSHIHPWGYVQQFPLTNSSIISLLPQYKNEGYLMLGLSGVHAPQSVSLLFCLEKQSVSSSENTPPEIHWAYLSGDRWTDFREVQISYDSTVGLIRTGIVTIELPADISTDQTVLPTGLCWIRAVAKTESNEVCNILHIKTQVFEATLQEDGILEDNYGTVLPVGSIKQSKYPIEGIQRVYQPLPSFDGKCIETKRAQTIRVGERLVHKQRASDAWDFEHLVLQQFPELLKVRCFEGMSTAKNPDPGKVLIVAIPEFQANGSESQPMLDFHMLSRIKEYLARYVSPFVQIEVSNPRYEQLQVRCTATFNNPENSGQQIVRLNTDIIHYLSPWHDNGREPEFGRNVRGTDVVGYILQLGYVKNVTNFSMLLITCDNSSDYRLIDTVEMMQNGNTTDGGGEMNYSKVVLSPASPWSIIISAPKHYIETSFENKAVKPEITGIEELEIGNNFIIK